MVWRSLLRQFAVLCWILWHVFCSRCIYCSHCSCLVVSQDDNLTSDTSNRRVLHGSNAKEQLSLTDGEQVNVSPWLEEVLHQFAVLCWILWHVFCSRCIYCSHCSCLVVSQDDNLTSDTSNRRVLHGSNAKEQLSLTDGEQVNVSPWFEEVLRQFAVLCWILWHVFCSRCIYCSHCSCQVVSQDDNITSDTSNRRVLHGSNAKEQLSLTDGEQVNVSPWFEEVLRQFAVLCWILWHVFCSRCIYCSHCSCLVVSQDDNLTSDTSNRRVLHGSNAKEQLSLTDGEQVNVSPWFEEVLRQFAVLCWILWHVLCSRCIYCSHCSCQVVSQDDNLTSDTSNRRVLHGSNAKEQLSLTDGEQVNVSPWFEEVLHQFAVLCWILWHVFCSRCIYCSHCSCQVVSQDDNLTSDTSNRRVLHGSNAKEQLSLTDGEQVNVSPWFEEVLRQFAVLCWILWHVFCSRCIYCSHCSCLVVSQDDNLTSDTSNRRVLHGSNAKEQLSLTDGEQVNVSAWFEEVLRQFAVLCWILWHVLCSRCIYCSHCSCLVVSQDDNLTSDTSNRRVLHGSNAKEQLSLTDGEQVNVSPWFEEVLRQFAVLCWILWHVFCSRCIYCSHCSCLVVSQDDNLTSDTSNRRVLHGSNAKEQLSLTDGEQVNVSAWFEEVLRQFAVLCWILWHVLCSRCIYCSHCSCLVVSQDDNLTSDTSNRRVLHGSNAKEQLSLTDGEQVNVSPWFEEVLHQFAVLCWILWHVFCSRCIYCSHCSCQVVSQDDNLTSDTSNRRVLHGSNAKEQLSLTDGEQVNVSPWFEEVLRQFAVLCWILWHVFCSRCIYCSHCSCLVVSQDDNLTSDTSNRRVLHGSNAKEQLSRTYGEEAFFFQPCSCAH